MIQIALHPRTFDDLRWHLEMNVYGPPRGSVIDMAYGVKLKVDYDCKEYRPAKWVFPKERFVKYTKSDEGWCRYFGFGHEIPEQEPELKIVRDLPLMEFEPSMRRVRFMAWDERATSVGHDFEDQEYVEAARAVVQLKKLLSKIYAEDS